MTGTIENPEGENESLRLSLHPNQSLSRSGFIAIMCLVCFVSFTYGLLFWRMGAWPIFGFFGLDVLLIYIAFRLSFRAARRYETIVLSGDMVTITRVAPDGKAVVETVQAYWSRALIERDKLWLFNRGHRFEIGNFLGEEEREEVRDVLAAALHDYRKGGIPQSPSPSTSIIS
ncbi:MAG: DUF2244 domain-containing protein [Alphaproteobacteria bacterium]|nr:MAG: DUF2244 domain-containing protein [Alphaproteobacteria bacterium]